jgi:hypothetical protein
MKRYTGQRALYEAWSLSRSKPKRHGLLERLRPQLEKLQAAASAKLKSAAPPVARPTSGYTTRVEPEEYRHEVRQDVARLQPPRLEPRPEVAVPAKVEMPAVEAREPSAAPVSDVSERKETRPPKYKGKGSKNRSGGQNGRNGDEAVKKETVETPTVNDSPSFSFADPVVVEEPKAEMPRVEAPNVDLPAIEPVKAEEPAPAVEETPVVPSATVTTETVEPTTYEPAEPIRGFDEVESPSLTEQTDVSPRTDTEIDDKLPRIGDRLRDYRSQRNEPSGFVRDSRPYTGLNMNFKPRPVQFIAGRVEISLPIKYAIPGVLVGLFIVLLLGRASVGKRQDSQGTVTITKQNPAASATNTAAVAQGNNRIVIAQAKEREQLGQLMELFRNNGIATGTMPLSALRKTLADAGLNTKGVPSGEGHLLMTYDLYNGVDKPGTDGYTIKQKIIDLGEKYTPKDGSVPFSRKDVYGLKVK